MKIYFFFLFFFSIGLPGSANRIDSLKTNADAEFFLRSLSPQLVNYPRSFILPDDSLRKKLACKKDLEWPVRSWQKIDLNDDGITDLIAMIDCNGLYPVFVIGSGENNFYFSLIYSQSDMYCTMYKPIKLYDKNLLVFYGKEGQSLDTLIYFFHGFVEYRRGPIIDSAIDSLSFESYNRATRTIIKINDSRIYRYTGNLNFMHDSSVHRLGQREIGIVKRLISYIDLLSLKNEYELLNVFDLPTSTIIVYYKNGITKKIVDHGRQGTFGLSLLYQLLYEFSQKKE